MIRCRISCMVRWLGSWLLLLGTASKVTSFVGKYRWVPTVRNTGVAAANLAALGLGVASSVENTISDGSATMVDDEEKSSTTSSSFVSATMRVYIEDTDAYGILYNTNYLKAYDRALYTAMPTIAGSEWSVVSFGQQKFRFPPVLGQEYIVKGTRKEIIPDGEVWDMELTSPDGSIIFNSISDFEIAIREKEEPKLPLLKDDDDDWLESLFGIPDENGYQRYQKTSTVYRDEMEAGGQLPLRSVLNHFERCRSYALGGPDVLRDMQSKDGILAVVTTIQKCSLWFPGGGEVVAGKQVLSETVCVPKRNGKIVECYQCLRSFDSNNSNNSIVAVGKVNLMFLDAATRKPIKGTLPQWLLNRSSPRES